MTNNKEYNIRQLRSMYESLIAFENQRIELNSLVGNLEFLLSALESVDDDWEEEFLNEATVLETINSIEIIKESGEEINEIDSARTKETLVVISVKILKK